MYLTTAAETLLHWAEQRPDALAMWIADEKRTFSELASTMDSYAALFAAHGLQRGDRVAIMTPTCFEAINSILAASRLGAIAVPLSIYLKGESLAHQLRDSGSSILISDTPGLDLVRALGDALPSLKTVFVVDAEDLPPFSSDGPMTVLPLASELTKDYPVPACPALNRRDPAAIIYTSGTTSLPKGCIISHGYLGHWARTTQESAGMVDGDRTITAAPLFHIGAHNQWMAVLSYGNALVLEPSFSASRFLPRAKETGATIAMGIGFIPYALMRQPPSESDRDHGIRKFITIQLTVDEQIAFHKRFGALPLTQHFGQTECWPISYTPLDQHRPGSSLGYPGRHLHVSIHDDDDCPVADGEIGEVVVRPREPCVMFDGYWGDPLKTLASFRDLWFHTGDLGRLVDGQLQFVDRKKDSMRRRGENVSAYELERTLNRFPAILEAATHSVALGADDDQEIKACIVLKEGFDLSVEELVKYMHSELPYYAVPRYIEILNDLPRNASGRVTKEALRATPMTDGTMDLVAMGHGVDRDQRRSVAGGN